MKETKLKFGLSNSTISKMHGVFAKYPQIDKVVIYGSRAKGNFKSGSDIDLTLFGSDLTYQLQMEVFDDLDELLLPYTIDLSVFDNLDNAKLREHIERVGVVFYERVSERQGWEEKTLKDLTTILGDGLHGTPKYTIEGEYYFINGNNLADGVIEFKENTKRVSIDEYNKHKKNLTNRTVLVSINGTLGNVAFYNNEKIILGKSACYFNLKESADKNFIKYVLLSPYFLTYAHKEATGATIKNVSLKTMREFKVPLPPLPEQQRIVSILDKTFAAIAKAKANAEQNLKNAKELFESYLQSVFETKGEGWEEKTLGELATFRNGMNFTKSSKGEKINIVGVKDFQNSF